MTDFKSLDRAIVAHARTKFAGEILRYLVNEMEKGSANESRLIAQIGTWVNNHASDGHND